MNTVVTSLSRIWAVFIKELIQMRRDRMTFGFMFVIPVVQLILFGFAINTTRNPLPNYPLTSGSPRPVGDWI